MKEIGIALLGLGNVGLGTYRILTDHAKDIERRLGAKVRVRHVLVRTPGKSRPEDVPSSLITQDIKTILEDKEVSVVVEVMGGLSPSREYLEQAIASGRHVVTANKALLSAHGEALFSRALARGVDVHFEGAVCGGIPIIRTLREALASDRVESLTGIVNGTTNFILSAMANEGATYADALRRAQELGYAEADPTLDVSGMDAAQKLCLLASLAFSARVSPESILVEGITSLTPTDISYGREAGYVLKLLARARRAADGLDVRVHPAFIPAASPLADVSSAFNAVLLQSAALGASLYSGRGAGALPTGSAVVSDIIDTCRNLLAGVSGRLPLPVAPNVQDVPLLPSGERRGPVYLRFSVSDEPGVLGRIASVLGEKGVSINSVLQRPPRPEDARATIVVFTHATREADVLAAVRWIDSLSSTRAPTQVIRIEEDPGVLLAAQ
ncbi:homoserine dehydrogenase [Vitiosangium sp. GDMCC 1.1324]|uniref:homoserine dehydrogenase n=1 Tax=Vitiosangium sp. (strain GDMCC 1.1324) TaxID=2138576 RepID=UPI000D3D634A|nr:homoserine dehydrogenase [Vitiosangium sp. GDMCC 1.1324]PTL85350.1 homoserine dehydrogenase [Vitiosangium sp. GDMCC 1.1324]